MLHPFTVTFHLIQRDRREAVSLKETSSAPPMFSRGNAAYVTAQTNRPHKVAQLHSETLQIPGSTLMRLTFDMNVSGLRMPGRPFRVLPRWSVWERVRVNFQAPSNSVTVLKTTGVSRTWNETDWSLLCVAVESFVVWALFRFWGDPNPGVNMVLSWTTYFWHLVDKTCPYQIYTVVG